MSKTKKINQNPATYFLISIMTGLAVFIILLSVCSFIVLRVSINKEYLFFINYAICAISIFTTSFMSAYKAVNKKLIKGLIASVVLTIIFTLIFFTINKYAITLKMLLIIAVCLISGFIGCVTGINSKR